MFNVMLKMTAVNTVNDESRMGCNRIEFSNILRSKNYSVTNLTDFQDDHYYYEAEKQNLNISFFEYQNNDDAYDSYMYFYDSIRSEANDLSKSIKIAGKKDNFNVYEVTDNEKTYIVARKNNTVVFSIVSSQYKEEIKQTFEILGYNTTLDINMSNFLIVFLLIFISIYTFILVIYWKIFVKAGYKGWKSLIPIYNIYLMFKVTFGTGWYFLLMFIPLVNFVIMFVLLYKLAKNFGKSTAFAICNMVLFIFTMQIIAFDESEYLLKK